MIPIPTSNSKDPEHGFLVPYAILATHAFQKRKGRNANALHTVRLFVV